MKYIYIPERGGRGETDVGREGNTCPDLYLPPPVPVVPLATSAPHTPKGNNWSIPPLPKYHTLSPTLKPCSPLSFPPCFIILSLPLPLSHIPKFNPFSLLQEKPTHTCVYARTKYCQAITLLIVFVITHLTDRYTWVNKRYCTTWASKAGSHTKDWREEGLKVEEGVV